MMVAQREVTPVKPGTAMEEQLQLKGIGRLLAGFGYRYGSEVQLHQALSTVLDQNQLRALAQQFLQQQGVALETTNVTTMETSR